MQILLRLWKFYQGHAILPRSTSHYASAMLHLGHVVLWHNYNDNNQNCKWSKAKSTEAKARKTNKKNSITHESASPHQFSFPVFPRLIMSPELIFTQRRHFNGAKQLEVRVPASPFWVNSVFSNRMQKVIRALWWNPILYILYHFVSFSFSSFFLFHIITVCLTDFMDINSRILCVNLIWS